MLSFLLSLVRRIFVLYSSLHCMKCKVVTMQFVDRKSLDVHEQIEIRQLSYPFIENIDKRYEILSYLRNIMCFLIFLMNFSNPANFLNITFLLLFYFHQLQKYYYFDAKIFHRLIQPFYSLSEPEEEKEITCYFNQICIFCFQLDYKNNKFGCNIFALIISILSMNLTRFSLMQCLVVFIP